MKGNLDLFLERLPLAHGLARACECQAFLGFQLKPPVLDLGCGDGTFAKVCFGNQKIKTGIDISQAEVEKARKSGAYKQVLLEDIHRLPFGKGVFATVIANSVLEHVVNVGPVLGEVNRVLEKGGQFIFTVPTAWVGENYLFTRIFRKANLDGLADWYVKTKNRFWHHFNLKDEKWWRQNLNRVGFKQIEVGFVSGGKVTALCDLMGFLALPAWLLRKLNLINQFRRPKIWVGFWSRLLKDWPEYRSKRCSTFIFRAIKR